MLILVEIAHTVVLSPRSHRLAAQPFIVVGLVAVIRRILVLLSTYGPKDNTELALLTGMVVVFVAGSRNARTDRFLGEQPRPARALAARGRASCPIGWLMPLSPEVTGLPGNLVTVPPCSGGPNRQQVGATVMASPGPPAR